MRAQETKISKALTIFAWLAIAIATLALIAIPVSLQVHLIMAVLLLSAMLVIKLLDLGGNWRLLLLTFGTIIVLRYAYWRTTSTIPPYYEIADFIPGLILYLAEMYCIVMLFLSLFVVLKPIPPRGSVRLGPNDRVPTVDIFIPTYNEDYELLAGTLAAAKAIDYPADKMTVWLLDDGATDAKRSHPDPELAAVAQERYTQLRALCEELGVSYLARPANEHAKAGNLNYGLSQSKGEFVAVFDADHAPARDFLQETVPYFDRDQRLFLVQTPHFFLNPDPLERNLRTFEVMPSENEMFYGIIQRGLDRWNASFFCGSAALLRREALEHTNGFSGRSITEDCETAIELHSRGWNSIYIDRPLVAGLQPATFASFIGQRTRWAQGMMQIMLFSFPLFKRGLKIEQRISYMSSTMFWLFPLSRMIFLFAPFCYLFLDLQIFTASAGEFTAYTLTYFIVNLVMQNSLFGRWRWPWISELYEYIQSVHLFGALLSVVRNPSKPSFKVTSKDESVDVSRLSELSRPFYIIFVVLVAALAMTIYKITTQPYQAEVTMVVGSWNIFNLIIAGCALGVVAERREQRASRRINVDRRCEVQGTDGTWLRGNIINVSTGGLAIRLPNSSGLGRGAGAVVRFTPLSQSEARELHIFVASTKSEGKAVVLGARYMPKSGKDYELIADLLYANSGTWLQRQKQRQINIGLIRGTLRFVGMALYQTGRGLGYLLRFGSSRTNP